MTIDAETLRKMLRYEPETGNFYWLVNRPRIKPGQLAGTVSRFGYRQIVVCRKHYYAHRLAWFYMNGEWPTETVDHIDGDRDNNRWANLRPASLVQQQRNTKLRADNVLGFRGVSISTDLRRKKYLARICVDGVQKNLGHFTTADEAAAAYGRAAVQHFGEYARA